jgi:hypothetical protein
MSRRASLLALCLAWMAYESHFSPRFFAATVLKSVADIRAGLDGVLEGDLPPMWRNASAERSDQ